MSYDYGCCTSVWGWTHGAANYMLLWCEDLSNCGLKKYLCVILFGLTCTDLNVRERCKKLLSHQPWLIWFYWGAGNLLVAVSVLPCLLCIVFVIFCSSFIYESIHWWLTRLLLKISAIQSYHHLCSSSYFILPSFWLKWFVQMNNRKSWRLIFAAIMSSLSTVFP